jgi:methyl-accepting chemotaxis protein
LRLAVNTTITKLAETVGTVVDSADQLNNASNQISGASQSLSQAATEQASSVEATTGNIEQMGAGTISLGIQCRGMVVGPATTGISAVCREWTRRLVPGSDLSEGI